MNLNERQLEARNKINGSLLIIAGAGSGKTATLTARVEYMISEIGIPSESILMVTFTNKAANEMKARVAKTLNVPMPRNLYRMHNFPLIGTFHSIGIFILRELLEKYPSNELNLGIKKDFVIYDETDKISIIKNILKTKLNLDEKNFPAKKIAFYISDAKNNMIGAKEYETYVDSYLKEIVGKAYLEYEDALQKNNGLDFDDILLKTYRALSNPEILEHYQEKYKYIMVDEYQDTNQVQYKIIKLLASKYKNLAVVGDDSQSIYAFRGADMRNIINFKNDYKDALVIKLEQNYRSSKKILAGANSVILNNNSGIKKELWTENSEGNNIIYIEAINEKIEAKVIADIIKNKHQEGGEYRDNLILYRTNAQGRLFEEALLQNNIPYRIASGFKFYDRAEIKDILAYLRIIKNPLDSVSMRRIINKPTRKIGDRSLDVLEQMREDFSINYIEIFNSIDEVEELNSGAKNAVKNFFQLYKEIVFAGDKLEVADLIREILSRTKYEEYITEGLTPEEKAVKIDNINELINLATEYSGLGARDSLQLFLEDISIITDMDTKDTKNDYVTLMTIHTSKGLEEKRVFLTGLEDGLFPSIKSMNEKANIEEERRLMYVAMTRAKEELYIARAFERFSFGEFMRNPPSRFIGEIRNEFIEKYDMSEYASRGNIFSSFSYKSKMNTPLTIGEGNYETGESLRAPEIKAGKLEKPNNVSDFSIGDKVLHPKFNIGIITELKGEIADIAFEGVGNKKLNIRIAPVRRM